jgi:hypothetical protein
LAGQEAILGRRETHTEFDRGTSWRVVVWKIKKEMEE